MKSTDHSGNSSRRSEAPPGFFDTNADSRRAETERIASFGTVAAGVAHELMNPLSSLLGGLALGMRELEGLRERMQGRPREDFEQASRAVAALDSAREGAERVRSILRDLMDFSRQAPNLSTSVDVESVLDAAIRTASIETRLRARVVKRYSGIFPVRSDGARLGQVFLNLILNAAAAIEGDASTNEITVATSSDDRAAVIEISATGGGIRAQELDTAFDPYGGGRTGGGLGLALAICRGIVTSLGGEMSVWSRPDRGRSFRVALPYASEESALRRGASESPPEFELPAARILVIDDEPLLGQTLLYAFKGRHEVVICTSGRDALGRLATDAHFDLVLCDVMMPDVSGAAVYESLTREHPELVPRFVFMTGGAFTERARELLSQYPGLQLEKPFKLAEIERLLCEFGTSRRASVR